MCFSICAVSRVFTLICRTRLGQHLSWSIRSLRSRESKHARGSPGHAIASSNLTHLSAVCTHDAAQGVIGMLCVSKSPAGSLRLLAEGLDFIQLQLGVNRSHNDKLLPSGLFFVVHLKVPGFAVHFVVHAARYFNRIDKITLVPAGSFRTAVKEVKRRLEHAEQYGSGITASET